MFKIVFFSFALTGVAYYVSKQEPKALPAREVAAVEPPVPVAPAPVVRAKKIAAVEAPAMPVAYSELLPGSNPIGLTESKPATKKIDDNFKQSQVRPDIDRCFTKMYKKRRNLKERDGSGSASVNGDLKVVIKFENSRPLDVHTVATEIRDPDFHNCIQTAAKGWQYPSSVSSYKQWTYSINLDYELDTIYKCKDSTSGVIVGSNLGLTHRSCN